jgi:enamine deaminase RidA (YjgF/YER057c/UK114 family)
MSTVEKRLESAGLTIPSRPAKPVGVYVPAVRTGNLLFVSGHGPLRSDWTLICGRVGEDVTVEQAAEAAKVTALSMLATVRVAAGSLDNVARIVKVLGLVRAVPEFTQQPKVVDGFTEVMRIAFGDEHGLPARSAIGVASLPAGICVEVEAIFELHPGKAGRSESGGKAGKLGQPGSKVRQRRQS